MQIRTNSRVLLLLGSLMAFAALIVLSGRWHSGEQVQAHISAGIEIIDTVALRDAAEHALNTGGFADANPSLVNYDSDRDGNNDTILIKVDGTTTVDTTIVAHVHDGATDAACGRETSFAVGARFGRTCA